ncbi:nitroreductase/quinone reductase family protein [Streptomyces sp. Je 1-332]|uniref:nitroreductase/quinone reductase family protein n=1 Tax=Streptomyces sp. Je 1-332 TaxID=3231270 RepID=UPI003457504F
MTTPIQPPSRSQGLRQRLLRAVGNSWLLRRCGPLLLPRLDRRFHQWTRGRWVPSRLLVPVLILHTTRRDGTVCHTPLLTSQTAADTFIVMATNFGRPQHPAWSWHLLREPRATVHWRRRSWPVQARLLSPEEQREAQDEILAAMPCFDDYARHIRREIRVFVLAPRPLAHTRAGRSHLN